MRNKLMIGFILILFFIFLFSVFFVYQKINNSSTVPNTQSKEQSNLKKNHQDEPKIYDDSCIKDEDCDITNKLPDAKGACVNKSWLSEWEKNPESKKYIFECYVGPACTGPEFVFGGSRMPKNGGCECFNNHCQISDLKNYPGCFMAGCD